MENNIDKPQNSGIDMSSVEVVDTAKQDALNEKYDKDASVEKIKKNDWRDKLVSFLGFCVVAYVLYTCGYRRPDAMLHRAIFLAMALTMAFLVYPMFKSNKGKLPKWYDYFFIAGIVIPCIYTIINFRRLAMSSGIAKDHEIILCLIMVLCVLEAVRRSAGLGMVIIISSFLLYGYFGEYAPSALAHPGLSLKRMASFFYLSTGGVYGSSVGTVAGMVTLFITFASFMEKTGVGQFINDFALAITGTSAGGPAKVSVITSALFGTISGNATSNVITTGAFTIPLMKKTGYSPEFAGAVEAVASTAGQLMPPVMGTSAFIMADVTGIPYSRICLAAVVPVLLYYVGCFTMVHLRAKKLGLTGIAREQCPKLSDVLRKDGYLFLPFIFVLVMLMLNYSVIYVGFWAIPVSIIIAGCKKRTRLSIKQIIEVMMLSGRRIISVGCICCGVSMIMAICNLTGVTQTLASSILNMSGGSFLISILLIAIISIIMGMGMPTYSVYMLLSTVAAPALIMGFNVPVIAAHFFVFYFGLLANVTPPVCVPAYVAAGLAESDPAKTAWQGFRLAMGGFLVPFVFVYSPDVLFEGATWITSTKIITAICGVYILSCGIEGWMLGRVPTWQRVLLIVAAAGMVIPEPITDIIGIAIALFVMYLQRKRRNELAMV